MFSIIFTLLLCKKLKAPYMIYIKPPVTKRRVDTYQYACKPVLVLNRQYVNSHQVELKRITIFT